MGKLDGKVALVTGAGRGIGAQIAVQFASEGATVVVNYSGNDAAAAATVERITAAGGTAESYKCNVADFEATATMINYVVEKFGKLDLLVNNAGITRDGLLMRMSEADFDSVIDVNLKGTFNTIKNVSRQMLKQKSGKIINMTSIVGLHGNAGQVNYAASKAGVIGITKSAAKELASRGITVNAIAPGYIDTDMTSVLSDSVKETIIGTIPLGRMGHVDDIAQAAVFLASDAANYITGQVISVDGGMNI